MRVVTYARVSSEKQGTLGRSLVSQSQKFDAWCSRGGHDVVKAYEERQSATTTVRRRLFTQMLAELDATRPQMIVVDSADRFSRNLEDVFDVMKRLRERGINIWPLEWERDDPPDIITYDSPDYLRFREEIIAAQAEAKRIKTRILRSYAAKRERGATTYSSPPFGVQRDGDALVPSPDAWVIEAVDAQLLAGAPIDEVAAWVRSAAPQPARRVKGRRAPWDSRQGLWSALQSPAYVAAGVRTAQQQAELDVMLALRRERFGRRRTYVHEFAGVFACGRCVAAGIPEAQALMGAWNPQRRGRELVPSVGCQHNVPASKRRHPTLTAVVARVSPAWWAFVNGLRWNAAALERWAGGAQPQQAVQRRRDLQRAEGRLDQEEAALIARRASAFDLLRDRDPELVASARRMLVDVERVEAQLGPRRSLLRAELASITVPARSAATLRAMLARLEAEYARWTRAEQNTTNRLLCAAIGSHPVVDRDGAHRWAPVRVSWPAVSEDVLEDAPRYRTRWRDTVFQDG